MILFVDDEPRYSRPYLDKLCQQYEVTYTGIIDDVMRLLREAGPGEVELLILDIMMPPSESFSDADTRDGLDTGIELFNRVREKHPRLPVIVLTNVTEETVARRFESEPNCWFLRKRDCLPHELNQKVKEILTGEATLKNNAL